MTAPLPMKPGTKPNMDRNRQIIATYESGQSLREVAKKFGVKMQAIHWIIKRYAPEVMRRPYYDTRK